MTEIWVETGRYVDHCPLDCAGEGQLGQVAGVDKYHSRALCLTSRQDVIRLHPDLRDEFLQVQEHYFRVGLKTAQEVVWSDRFGEDLENFPEVDACVFFFGERAHSKRPDENWFRIAQNMNEKNQLIRLCNKLGVPTPKTLCYDSRGEVGSEIKGFSYPCFLKLSCSVSGMGVWKCENAEDLQDKLEHLGEKVPFQVQQSIRTVAELSVQYWVEEGGVRGLGWTEMILDGVVHQGNRAPTKHCAWEVTDPLAQQLGKSGMRGHFGFDLSGVQRENGAWEYFVLECNPRFTGASYPMYVCKRLGARGWWMQNYQTSKRSLSALDLSGLEYNPERKSGVVVINWGTVGVGKLGIVILGEPSEWKETYEELKKRL